MIRTVFSDTWRYGLAVMLGLTLSLSAAWAHEGGGGHGSEGGNGHGAVGEGRLQLHQPQILADAPLVQRRADIRAAVVATRPAAAASAATRRLSDQERVDLREQLRREMQAAQMVTPGS